MSRSLASFIALSTLVLFSNAAPISNAASAAPVNGSSLAAAYTIPLTNGTTSLPSPPTPIKVITAGRGTQNYTCATSDSTSTPVSVGAVATLFDLASLLPILSPLEGQAVLNALPPLLLSLPRDALSNSIIPQAGMHYFDASGSATFDLSASSNGILVGTKVGDIQAPESDSTNGSNGAVDWLALDAKAGSVGLSRGYRTETASGKPPATCDGLAATFEVEYCALYYFLGE